MLWITLLAMVTLFPAVVFATDFPIVFSHEIPYGQGKSGWVCENSTVSGLLRVESRYPGKLEIDYQLQVPAHLVLQKTPPDMSVEKNSAGLKLKANFLLMTRGDQWFRVIEIHLPQGIAENGSVHLAAQATIHGVSDGQSWCMQKVISVKVLNERILQQSLGVTDFIIPADEQGLPQKRLKKNTILLHTENLLARWLGGEHHEDPTPSAYAAVGITSKLEDRVNLLARLDFLDPRTRLKVAGFDPVLPQGHEGLGRRVDGVYQMVCLPPRDQEKVVLPIYARDGMALPGHYLARLSLRHFGTDSIIGHYDYPIEVSSPKWGPLIMTLFSLAAAVGMILLIYLKRNYFLRLKTRELITIALFGTIIFAVVNVPGTLLWRFAHIFLGPFSFFITGFFHEIIFYMLLTSLVVLIPKPGAITLVIIIKSLMSDLLFGGFSATSFLNMGVAALTLETAYYLCGLTRRTMGGTASCGRLQMPARTVWITALVCGLGDMLISYVNFNIFMLLYRLYYATWYIAVYLFVSGFLYTLIAVPLGFTLSRRLSIIGG
ncbi:MAG: hypothetical protein AB1611_11130 [bacterium]